MARSFKPRPKNVAHRVNIGDGALFADFVIDQKRPGESYLKIYSPHHKFTHIVQGSPFLYLLEALRQNKPEEVEAYCAMIWRVSQEVYEDKDLCVDIVNAIRARDNRLMEKAARKAASVSDVQEEADQALMTDVAREADRNR